MIYSTVIDKFPKPDQSLEEISYRDKNDFEWKISRIKSGFFFAYFGRSYFKHPRFEIEVNGRHFQIVNTGCFYVEDTGLEAFCNVRDILMSGWTDAIWETIEELLTERLKQDPGLMDCETVKR